MDRLTEIQQGLRGIAKHIEIVQAIGDAAQDLLRPDEEEVQDILLTEGDETLGTNRTLFFETCAPSSLNTFTATPPLPRTERHLFRYFLDGSVHGRAIGTGLEGTKSFPLAIFQIGAAVIVRDSLGYLSPQYACHRVIATIQGGADGVSTSRWEHIAQEEAPNSIFHTVKVEPRAGREIRAQSNSVAFSRMHNLELDYCARLAPLLDQDCRAIIDGSVKLGALVTNPSIIGVAKSFWTMPTMQVNTPGGARSTRLNLTRLLTSLPVEHRTPVFAAAGESVGFWYLRLRHVPGSYPLYGVIKVELPRPTRAPVDSQEADYISRALVAEKRVTPYGLDKRWHCLLYPIHHAEQLIKRGFFSEQILDRLVRSMMSSPTQS
jgi:hypothetical protein